MKIKKKNTTIPISGKIVDTENVEDKTSNAPSMRLFEEKIQDLTIEQANDFVVANNGYTVEDSNIFKQGKHYWGYIIIKKDSGIFSDNDEKVANLTVKSTNVINNACYLTDDKWASKGIGYLYISQYQINDNKVELYPFIIVKDTNNSNSNYAKLYVDIVEQ